MKKEEKRDVAKVRKDSTPHRKQEILQGGSCTGMWPNSVGWEG